MCSSQTYLQAHMLGSFGQGRCCWRAEHAEVVCVYCTGQRAQRRQEDDIRH